MVRYRYWFDNVSTAYVEAALSASGVMHIISNNRKPILAGMIYAGQVGHMVVINGWTLVGSSIGLVFMDPKVGSTVASVSGNGPVALPLGGYVHTMREYII